MHHITQHVGSIVVFSVLELGDSQLLDSIGHGDGEQADLSQPC